MSGVGLTGKTVPLNGGSFPVFEDIDGLGGLRAVADTAARDLIFTLDRKIGMQVITQNDGQGYQLVGGTANANWQPVNGLSVLNYRASLFIDTAATNAVQNGSQSNPFRTFALAIAASPAAGAIFFLPPDTTHTESVTFPTAGKWEICCQAMTRAALVGNVVCTSPAQANFRLTNIDLTGTITGVATSAVGNLLYLVNCSVNGNISLTGSGSGFWYASFIGYGANIFGISGSSNGTVTVAGEIFGNNWTFGTGNISCSSLGILVNCNLFTGTNLVSTGNAGWQLQDTSTSHAITVTGNGVSTITLDDFTYAQFATAGVTYTTCIVSVTTKAFGVDLTDLTQVRASSAVNQFLKGNGPGVAASWATLFTSPANPGDTGKVVTANAGDFAYSIGAVGQALITTAGPAATWGTDFAAQNLTTTGGYLGNSGTSFLQLGTTAAGANRAALTGNIRLKNLFTVNVRNAADSADLTIATVDATNKVILGTTVVGGLLLQSGGIINITGSFCIINNGFVCNGGIQINVATSTTASVGAASALPALPLGYFPINFNGSVSAKVPFYAV